MAKLVHAEKLAVFMANALINEREIRNYVIDRWNYITKGMNNSTILFMAGVHGTDKGTCSEKAESFENIIGQVSFNL